MQEKAYPSYYANFGEAELLGEISESGRPEDFSETQVGATEKVFQLTDSGRKVANALRHIIQQRGSSDIGQLDGILQRYGSLPLDQIIRYVYRRYPTMAKKSVHPEASKLDAEG